MSTVSSSSAKRNIRDENNDGTPTTCSLLDFEFPEDFANKCIF